MGKHTLLVMALAFGACGGDEPPSCQDAIESFYAAGCTFYDPSGNPPVATTQNQALAACQGINVDVPERCRSKFDDWKFCLVSVANDTQCADCSGESDALFACD